MKQKYLIINNGGNKTKVYSKKEMSTVITEIVDKWFMSTDGVNPEQLIVMFEQTDD